MSEVRTKLERVGERVPSDGDAFERLSRYRRRRDRNRRIGTAALALAVAASGIGIAISAFGVDQGERPAPSPGGESGLSVGGIVRRDTPEGEAAAQLVVEPRAIRLGETVAIRLVNRGEVELFTGLPFAVERWDGERWVDVPWPEDVVFPLIGIILQPGGTTDPGTWPVGGLDVEPGLYRAVKSAHYEDPEYVRPTIELEARASFRILAADAPTEGSSCFSDAAGLEAPGGRRGPLVGDVSGDGSADQVFVTARTAPGGRCSYFLEVETEDGLLRARIRELGFSMFDWYLRPLLLADIDGTKGLEVVVDVYSGAATQFARVFTLASGSLAMAELPDAPQQAFAYSGSLSSFGAVDCVMDGEIVVLEAGRKGTRYAVTRAFYRVEETAFVLDRSESFTLSYERIEERFPEIPGDLPFAKCPGLVHGP